MSALDLDAIKAREAAATPGPWKWEEPSSENFPMADESLLGPVPEGETYPVSVLSGWGYDASGTHAEPQDRDFIAHARTDVPALVAEVERLHAALASMVRVAARGHVPEDVLTVMRRIQAGVDSHTIRSTSTERES